MSTPRSLVGLVLLACACGDDGGDPDAGVNAADYAGTWVISSVTLSDQGTPLTLVRDGDPAGFRGDAIFTATGRTTGMLDVRQVVLEHGLIASEIMSIPVTVTVEVGRWVLADPGGVSVYTTALTGDHLVLAIDPADPRNTNVDPTTEIIVDRVPPWTTTSLGTWNLVSMTLSSGTVTANACTQVQSAIWAKVQMMITFDDRLLFARMMTTTTYSDDACTTMIDTATSVQTGFAEEVGGTTLRMWGTGDGEAEFLGFAIAAAGNQLTLTRTSCLPEPACVASTPTTVVVTRMPTRR